MALGVIELRMIGGGEQDGEGSLVVLHVPGDELAVDMVAFARARGECEHFVPSCKRPGHPGEEITHRGVVVALTETAHQHGTVVMQVLQLAVTLVFFLRDQEQGVRVSGNEHGFFAFEKIEEFSELAGFGFEQEGDALEFLGVGGMHDRTGNRC